MSPSVQRSLPVVGIVRVSLALEPACSLQSRAQARTPTRSAPSRT